MGVRDVLGQVTADPLGVLAGTAVMVGSAVMLVVRGQHTLNRDQAAEIKWLRDEVAAVRVSLRTAERRAESAETATEACMDQHKGASRKIEALEAQVEALRAQIALKETR